MKLRDTTAWADAATAQRDNRHVRSVPEPTNPAVCSRAAMPWILRNRPARFYGSAPAAFAPHHSRTADTRDRCAHKAGEALASVIRPLASVVQPAGWVLVSGSCSSFQLSLSWPALVLVLGHLAIPIVSSSRTAHPYGLLKVALPSIRHALHFSFASLPWSRAPTLLTYGGFMLLGDRRGSRL
jgi:hypothetical protein